ncbi:MAG: hypothetical protein IT260_23650 [Saprospiraceae bacterium]|nr:hypothetical protein [Saprospiraceae bacterium]
MIEDFAMRITLLLVLFYTSHFTLCCQSIEYNFSYIQDGYRGKVKSVTSYALTYSKIDSVKVDSVLARKGSFAFQKVFNEKGLLERIETCNLLNDTIEKIYKYDADNNIVAIARHTLGSSYFKTDTFIYNNVEMYLLQIMNDAEKIHVEGKSTLIYKKKLVFDCIKRHIRTEYYDENEVAVSATRFYYDYNSKLIVCETVDGAKTRNRYFQTFDSTGRKRNVQFVDGDGSFTMRSVYTWLNDNTLLFEMFNAEGKLEVKHKEFVILDKYGNVIKKYFYDLIGGTAIVFEYEFAYY